LGYFRFFSSSWLLSTCAVKHTTN